MDIKKASTNFLIQEAKKRILESKTENFVRIYVTELQGTGLDPNNGKVGVRCFTSYEGLQNFYLGQTRQPSFYTGILDTSRVFNIKRQTPTEMKGEIHDLFSQLRVKTRSFKDLLIQANKNPNRFFEVAEELGIVGLDIGETNSDIRYIIFDETEITNLSEINKDAFRNDSIYTVQFVNEKNRLIDFSEFELNEEEHEAVWSILYSIASELRKKLSLVGTTIESDDYLSGIEIHTDNPHYVEKKIKNKSLINQNLLDDLAAILSIFDDIREVRATIIKM